MKLTKLIDEKSKELIESASDITESIVEFVKRNKKLIGIVVIIYLVFNWLFSEE